MVLQRVRSNYKDRLGRLPPARWANSPASLDCSFVGALKLPAYMAHTRAQVGGCFNENGVWAYPPHNLLTYSSVYANAVWQKGRVNVSDNSVANPVNGATTACTVTAQAIAGAHYVRQSVANMSGLRNVSFYVKAGTHPYVAVRTHNGVNAFNLTTGTWINALVGSARYAEQLSNGWWRLGADDTWAIGTTYYGCSPCDATGNETWTSVGTETFFLYSVQLTLGPGMKGTIETAATPMGSVCFDHDPGAAASGRARPKGLQVGRASTNLAQYSEEFNDAFWSKGAQAAVNPNAYAAPDGQTTADQWVASAGGTNNISRAFTTTTGTNYASSVFLRYVSGSPWARLMVYSDATNLCRVWVNIATGAIGTSGAIGTATLASTLVKKCRDGWVRIGAAGKMTTTTLYWILSCVDADNSATQAAGTFGVWGGQFEQSDIVTDYKPNNGSMTTAGALDLINITGSAAAGIINTSQGTMLVVFDLLYGAGTLGGSRDPLTIDGGNNNDMHQILASGTTTGQTITGTVTQASIAVAGALDPEVTTRLVYGYANNNCDMAKNGSLGANDPASPNGMPPVTTIVLGNRSSQTAPLSGRVQRVNIYRSRLTREVMAILSDPAKTSMRALRWRNYRTTTTRRLRRAGQPCAPVG